MKEIADARLTPGEEEELSQERRRAANAARLVAAAATAGDALAGGEQGAGAMEALDRALRALEDAAALDPMLAPSLETVRSASFELAEAERDLRHYQNSVEVDPERLAIIEERLDLIRTLGRKYGDSVAEILHYGEETAAKLDALSLSLANYRPQHRAGLLVDPGSVPQLARALDSLMADSTRRR